MSLFYNGQNSVKIRLTALGNLSDVQTALIKYKKPDGTIGSWPASVEDAVTGIIFYDLLPADELTTGDWVFWAHTTYTDTRVGIGDAVKITVKPEGCTR